MYGDRGPCVQRIPKEARSRAPAYPHSKQLFCIFVRFWIYVGGAVEGSKPDDERAGLTPCALHFHSLLIPSLLASLILCLTRCLSTAALAARSSLSRRERRSMEIVNERSADGVVWESGKQHVQLS